MRRYLLKVIVARAIGSSRRWLPLNCTFLFVQSARAASYVLVGRERAIIPLFAVLTDNGFLHRQISKIPGD